MVRQIEGLEWQIADNLEELAQLLIQQEIKERSTLHSVVLPGGKSILPLYEALEKDIEALDIVRLFLTDERMVPINHEASNEGQLVKHYPRLASRLNGFHNADLLEILISDKTENRLAILGAGLDGHFASLFPGDPGFAESDVLHRWHKPDDNWDRMSLGFDYIAGSSRVILWVHGAEKGILGRYLARNQTNIPIVRLWLDLIQQQKQLILYCDQAFQSAFEHEYDASL